MARRRSDGDWISLPDSTNRLSGDVAGGGWWALDPKSIGDTNLIIKESNGRGHKVAELAHDSPTHAVAISRLGQWIASTTSEHKVFLWPWRQDRLIALTCSLLPGGFTDNQWKELTTEYPGLGSHTPACGGTAPPRSVRPPG